MKDKYKKYIEYIARDIELPYIKYLEAYGLKQDDYHLVLSKSYNQPVTIKGRNVYNTNGNIIYYENSTGSWAKHEYNADNQMTYHENSAGSWGKYEYDDNGNEIYYETSNGVIMDRR